MKIYLTDIFEKTIATDKLFLLSERGKRNFERYKNAPRRALQSAVGDLLLKNAILKTCPDLCAPLFIEESSAGKPFINGAPDFSISHSENLIAVAVADDGENGAGVDVQLLKEPLSQSLIKGTLSENEKQKLLLIRNEPDRVKYFYKLFTEKESFVKFTGEGFTKFPRDVTDFSGAKFLTKYVFRQSELYCLTVCSQNILSIKINVVPFESLLN